MHFLGNADAWGKDVHLWKQNSWNKKTITCDALWYSSVVNSTKISFANNTRSIKTSSEKAMKTRNICAICLRRIHILIMFVYKVVNAPWKPPWANQQFQPNEILPHTNPHRKLRKKLLIKTINIGTNNYRYPSSTKINNWKTRMPYKATTLFTT